MGGNKTGTLCESLNLKSNIGSFSLLSGFYDLLLFEELHLIKDCKYMWQFVGFGAFQIIYVIYRQWNTKCFWVKFPLKPISPDLINVRPFHASSLTTDMVFVLMPKSYQKTW